MALTLLGHLKGVSNLSGRRYGKPAALWRAALPYYFEGMNGDEMVRLLNALDLGLFVRWRSGRHGPLVKLVRTQIERGRLAIIGWRSRNERFDHWVLAVGVEGVQFGDRFRTKTILCLDPSSTAPTLCGYNARLELVGNPSSYGSSYLRYLTNQGHELPVMLTETVILGELR
jgi:hypothetical protein